MNADKNTYFLSVTSQIHISYKPNTYFLSVTSQIHLLEIQRKLNNIPFVWRCGRW